MTSNEYRPVLDRAMARYSELQKQKLDLEAEEEKTIQFIFATINMLTDDERLEYLGYLQEWSKSYQKGQESLADAIRETIYSAPKQWFTVAQVRDRLINSGFDFSKYQSNPLASVSTTLKRLLPKDAETHTVDGVTVYRARNTKAAREREARRSMLRLYRSVFGENFTEEELQGLLTATPIPEFTAEEVQVARTDQTPALPEPGMYGLGTSAVEEPISDAGAGLDDNRGKE